MKTLRFRKKVKGSQGSLILMGLFLFPVVFSSASLWAGVLKYDTDGDWTEGWTFPGKGLPKATLEIADGWVRPVYIGKNINACLTAPDFVTEKDREGNPIRQGGILGAGSNFSRAKNILDGRRDTFWSPDPRDDLKEWWVEVDLGRAVTATKVRLVFADTALVSGTDTAQIKPLEQFELYVSNGEEAFYFGSGVLDYRLVGRTTQPNREYVLEYPLEKEVVNGEEVSRQMVRYVYLKLTSHSEAPGQLAELEVYSLGDNLMLGALDRRGYLTIGVYGEEQSGANAADGDYTSTWNAQTVIFEWRQKGWLRVDLGSLFWLDTIRIWGVPKPQTAPLLGYKLFISDGTLAPGAGGAEGPVMGNFVWQEVASLEKNPPEWADQSLYIFEDTFSPRPARYIFFSHRNNETDRGTAVQVWVAEIQTFGEGYVPGATLTSNLIDLGRSKNLTSIAWEADTPPGTAVEIRTRTGDEVEEIVHYYCRDGKECDKRKWDKEKSLFGTSGDRVVEQRPDATWSAWSGVYLHPGDTFASPSPRKYLLVEAKLSSDAPDVAPALDSITLFYTDPVARELKGQIYPLVVQAARPEDLFYYIEPFFADADQGFDEILIRTPARAELIAVAVADTIYSPQDLDQYVTVDSLRVHLPVRVTSETEPGFVQVQFRCEVFENNTRFDAFAADSRQRDSWQRVDPMGKGATTVMLPVTEELIEGVILPRIITPNGDGINDRASIEFTLLKVDQPRSIRVCICNLRGETVTELEATEKRGQSGLSGRYSTTWDGRDDAGEMLLPGIYLCRIEVDAEAGKAAVTRTISLVF